jgi:biopolymer transport protein ExbD
MSASADQQAEEVPISSLIDVVFLLIMFFVATASVEKDGFDDTVMLAESKHMQVLKTKKPSYFPVSINKENMVKVNGTPFTMDEMNALTRWASDHRKIYGNDVAEVMLRVDGRVKMSVVNKVIEAVNGGGLYKVKITAQKPGE